jgi:hypothetical protein
MSRYNLFRTCRNSDFTGEHDLCVPIVSGQSLKLLTSMDGLWKLMSDINQQVRHYFTCVCLYFLRLLLELYKIMVSKRPPPQFVTYLVKEVIPWNRNFGLYCNFEFSNHFFFSHNAASVLVHLRIAKCCGKGDHSNGSRKVSSLVTAFKAHYIYNCLLLQITLICFH